MQDAFLSFRLRLFLAKNVSGAAVPGVYPQDVLASEALNRALQDDRAVGSLTDLLRYLGGEARLGRPVHQPQHLVDLLIRDERQEGGLFQLNGQALSKDSIEYRIAGLFSNSPSTILAFRIGFGTRSSEESEAVFRPRRTP